MPQPLRLFLLLLVLGTVGAVWVRSRMPAPRRRRLAAVEASPPAHGPRLLVRFSPFLAVLAAVVAYGVLAQAWSYAIWGALGLMLLGSELSRRWRPAAVTQRRGRARR